MSMVSEADSIIKVTNSPKSIIYFIRCVNESLFLWKTLTDKIWQVGPRLSFSTAWSANAVSICSSCGLSKVTRIEVSRRYMIRSAALLSAMDSVAFSALVGISLIHAHNTILVPLLSIYFNPASPSS